MQDIQYITGFTAGELTPWLSTRFDLQAYRRGAALLSNFEVQPYGGIRRRHGSTFVAAAAEASGAVRLVPFHFSQSDSLMLELYPGGMRVYREGSLLTDDTGAPYVLDTPWSTAEQLGALRFTQINDVVYVTGPHHPPYCLARSADTAWSCRAMFPTLSPEKHTCSKRQSCVCCPKRMVHMLPWRQRRPPRRLRPKWYAMNMC